MRSKLRIDSDGERTFVWLDDKLVPYVTGVSWEQKDRGQVPKIHLDLAMIPIRVSGELASMQDQHGRKIRRIEFEDGAELVAADNHQPVDGETPSA